MCQYPPFSMMTLRNCLIGYYIVDFEQLDEERAQYGKDPEKVGRDRSPHTIWQLFVYMLLHGSHTTADSYRQKRPPKKPGQVKNSEIPQVDSQLIIMDSVHC